MKIRSLEEMCGPFQNMEEVHAWNRVGQWEGVRDEMGNGQAGP